MNVTKQYVEGGHHFICDEFGNIDTFRTAYDYHNGPECFVCSESRCHHCDTEFNTEKCPLGEEVMTLPGLEF